MEHVAVNSRLHAQQGIRPSSVVKFHQIPTSNLEEVAFREFWTEKQTDGRT